MKPRSDYMKGQIAVVMTFAIATLLGAMALGTDVAVMYFNWVQLQKAADAAALAGAFYLVPTNSVNFPLASIAAGCANAQAVNQTSSDDPARAACTYAVNNNMANDANDLKIYEPGIDLPASAPTPNVEVWVNRSNIPYFFGKVIGLSTYNVSAKATAAEEATGEYSGHMFPVLYDCTSPCTGTADLSGFVSFGSKFIGGSASGNWQFVDAGQGTGGSALKAAISGGVSVNDLTIGSTIKTDTGYDVGNVNKGWQNLMTAHTNYCATVSGCWDPSTMGSSCPSGTYSGAPNDPLLVTIPVGDTSGCNGSCSLTVEGFARVYLTGLTQSSCTGSNPCWNLTGCFVKADTPGGGGSASAPQLGSIPPPNLIQ
jgi:Flp pilus assembly protein TadG